MRKLTSIILLALLISSCHQSRSDKSAYVSNELMMDEALAPARIISPTPAPSPLTHVENKEVIKKKIIKDGRIGIEVQELEKAKAHIDSLIVKFDGYYANEKLNNSDWETSYNLKIRVPSKRFEQLINGIESGGGEIKFKEIDARDVTDQFIDLESRLANKKNYLKRYNDLLKRAKTIKDILEIEEKIRGIEEEIESTTGRLKYLGDLVNFSTLDLEISEPKEYTNLRPTRAKFTKRLKSAFTNGWFGFVDFIVLFTKVWPFWILITLLTVLWRKRRMNKKKRATSQV